MLLSTLLNKFSHSRLAFQCPALAMPRLVGIFFGSVKSVIRDRAEARTERSITLHHERSTTGTTEILSICLFREVATNVSEFFRSFEQTPFPRLALFIWCGWVVGTGGAVATFFVYRLLAEPDRSPGRTVEEPMINCHVADRRR